MTCILVSGEVAPTYLHSSILTFLKCECQSLSLRIHTQDASFALKKFRSNKNRYGYFSLAYKERLFHEKLVGALVKSQSNSSPPHSPNLENDALAKKLTSTSIEGGELANE